LTTIVAGEAVTTNTLEAALHLNATAAISAWLCKTKIDTFLAIFARITRTAFALILINTIDTCATVLAWISLTIVNVLLACRSMKAFCALTLIIIAFQCHTFTIILAWIGRAILDLHLTVSTTEASQTFTSGANCLLII
jgi:hypothetical protein